MCSDTITDSHYFRLLQHQQDTLEFAKVLYTLQNSIFMMLKLLDQQLKKYIIKKGLFSYHSELEYYVNVSLAVQASVSI